MSATPSGGVLSFALVDATNTIFNNEAGTANNVTKDLTTVSTTWVPVSGFFQTPSVLPAEPLKFRIKLTTALQNAKTVYIDDVTMIVAGQLYAGGPFIGIFPGSVATVLNDTMTVTVANNWAGKFQKAFQTFFDMRSIGVQLPSSGSPSISDSLVS